ncbi:thaumatin family protein [Sporobolomyces salmoneus]|uniref:thaumatin family protein n=1 Tax=Sporobolomyces salmoneus TaxID=183962 RepID=UPI0031771A02
MPRRTIRLPHLALVLSLCSIGASADNRVITVVNNCDYTIWPAIFRSVGPYPKQKTGWEAPPGTQVGFEVEESWGGRVWGRTGCDFTKDVPDYMQCETGGCIGGIKRTGKLPVTIAEFNIQEAVDHYDTSNVDGFNIPMAVTNSADCPLSNCPYDLREACPDDLQWKNDKGDVVGCLTDCGAHQDNQEYCCFGAHELPENCPSSAIPNYPWWKKNCPIAYAYAYDESSQTALFTCEKRVNWMITFCPGPELYSSVAILPNGTEITQGGDYPDYPKGTAKDGGGAPDQPENESSSDTDPNDSASSSSGGGGGGSSSGGGGGTETGTEAKPSSSSGGSGGGNSTPTGSGSGGGASASSSPASTPSKTGSTSPSPSSGSSSSSSSSSSDSDDLLFGFPKTYVYAGFGALALLVLAVVVYLVMSKKDKKKHKHRTDESDSDSRRHSSKKKKHVDTESETEAGTSTQEETETESSDTEDDRKSRKSLAKLDRMERAEKSALNARSFAGEREGRLFSMGRKGYESSEDELSSDEEREARMTLRRKSLASV